MEKQPKQAVDFGQAASEKLGLAYHLIPPESLRRLSRIFLEGMEKYPGKAVNAKNMEGTVGNTHWQWERFNHAVDHLLKWGQGDTSEDHLAKVMWFCSVMIEVERIEEDQKGLVKQPRTKFWNCAEYCTGSYYYAPIYCPQCGCKERYKAGA